MFTLKSTYTFPAVIDADGDVAITAINTVKFENQGQQTVIIDGTYKITPGSFVEIGGRYNSTIEQTFAITFTGVGTKALYLIEEVLTKV